MRLTTLLSTAVLVFSLPAVSRTTAAQESTHFTHADTLRGSNGPGRAWWDAEFYDLHIGVNPADSSVRGWNTITYRVIAPAREMQLDLREPLVVDSVLQGGRKISVRRDSDAFFVRLPESHPVGSRGTVSVYYHGRPRVAHHAPWDGGIVWTRDSLGNTYVASAVEGFGASGWWPLKDYLADEPDSQRVAITVPDPLVDVSNGRLRSVTHHPDHTTTYEWFVKNPINSYDVALNAGAYVHFSQMYEGENGPLTMDFWPLAYHLEAAQQQFKQATTMMSCFEHWFGPFPWYEDGYKLVETPHLGMEHQSAVGYGNRYQNGYLGTDLSNTGYGLRWDFIIVHESAHEWWGNSISGKDHADMWVHESFANYAEALYTECRFGKDAGARYQIGSRAKVRNDAPIVPAYGVNAEGSGDMYYKGGNMLHTIRQVVNDDEKWRGILRGLQSTFRHQTVSGKQVEDYISEHAGSDLAPVFAEYLTTTQIPALEYRLNGSSLSYRWADVVPNFAMPVRVTLAGRAVTLHPTTSWQTMPTTIHEASELHVDPNFYVTARVATAP
jgi:aminopeptidase N